MITVYDASATDFASLGLCVLQPTEATITGEENGMMELNLKHPMDSDGRWMNLVNYNIIKAPSPVRETPLLHVLDDAGTASKTVTRTIYKVKTRTGKRLRLHCKPSKDAGSLDYCEPGTEVVLLESSGIWYHVMLVKGGKCGWMDSTYLVKSREETETVPASGKEVVTDCVELAQTRAQLFRICSVERDDQAQLVTVTAKHIFYDLAANTVKSSYSPENRPVKEVCEALLSNALNDHNFAIYCTAEGNVTGDYSRLNIANCLLEDETGVAYQAGAKVVLDNFDIFVLKNEVRDTGVEIRHAKNLKGAVLTENAEEVITRIIPVGKDKNGDPLPLPNNEYVESPNAANIPVVRSKAIDYDVTVGKNDGEFSTNEKAYAELRRLAKLDFTDNGADSPTINLDVDFVALETTTLYANYAPLQAVHMGDTVRVISSKSGIDAKLRVTGFTFNCLYGATGRYDSISLGDISELNTTTYGFDIAASSITGAKLVPNSVDGSAALRSASINYAKIAQAAIEQLSANSITAVRADIHDIVSKTATTDELYADLATIATATIMTADIDWASIKNLTAEVANIADAQIASATITTAQIKELNAAIATVADAHIKSATIQAAQIDDLSTVIAKAIHSEAETGTFTLAEIKNLVANALILKEGIADSMTITNLAVTSANLLNATVDKLVLKGSDGKYYHVFIAADGAITTEETTPTAAEIEAGETSDGRKISETTADVAGLNTQTVKAKEAILGTIFTESLTAGKITANEALISSASIPMLYVTALTALGSSIDISANESIVLTTTSVEAASQAAETATDKAENCLKEIDTTNTAVEQLQTETQELQTVTTTIQNQVVLNRNGLDVLQTNTEEIDGRVKTLESGVHIDGSTIEIYTSDSAYRNKITNDGWQITENGSPVITCAETKLTAPRVAVTDALIIGGLAWKPSSDKHVRLLKYGR